MADSYLIRGKVDTAEELKEKMIDNGDGTFSSGVAVTGRNQSLLAAATVTWNGVKTSDTVTVPVGSGTAILIDVDNDDQAQGLTLTFEYEVSSGVWRAWRDGAGVVVSIPITASSRAVYGPVVAFPRYLNGRIKLTAGAAPADTKTTIVQVQEVD